MPISYRCEHCSQKLTLPDKALGKRIQCPKCQAVLLVQASVSDTSPPKTKSVSPVDHLLDGLVPEAKAPSRKKDDDEIGLAALPEDKPKPSPVQPKPQSPPKPQAQPKPQRPAQPQSPGSSGAGMTLSGVRVAFGCQSCGKTLKAPGTALGKKVKCPHCQSVQVIPADATIVAPGSSQSSAAMPAAAKKPAPASPSVPDDPFAPLPESAASDPFASLSPDPMDPFAAPLGAGYGLAPAAGTASAKSASSGNSAMDDLFGPAGAQEDPFAGLLDTIPDAATSVGNSPNPYESPTQRSTTRSAAPKRAKRRQGGYYAPIGEVISETYKTFTGNMSIFIGLGGQTFFACLGFSIAFNYIVGRIVRLLAGSYIRSGGEIPALFIIVFLVVYMLVYALFYTAIYLGNQTCAYNITGGRDSGGLFEFDQGHYVNSVIASGMLTVLACLIAVPIVYSTQSVALIAPEKVPDRAALEKYGEYAASHASTQPTLAMYRFSPQWDSWDEDDSWGNSGSNNNSNKNSDNNSNEDAWDSWDSPSEENDSGFGSSHTPFQPQPSSDGGDAQEFTVQDGQHYGSAGGNAAPMDGTQKFALFIFYASMITSLLNCVTPWTNLFIIDRESFGPVALVQAVVFFFVNIGSVILGGLLFFLLPIGAAVIVCVIAFQIGFVAGVVACVCCGLFAAFTIMPLTMCFLAVTYRLATYGSLGSSRKSGGSGW